MNNKTIPEVAAADAVNKLARVSLYTGAVSLLFCIFGIAASRVWQQLTFFVIFVGLTGGIVAAILGNIARRQIRVANGSRKDKRMAMIGINLGLLPLLFLCLYFAYISPQLH